MSELALIERIAARTGRRPGTSLGIGDDAAIVDLEGAAVVTHDMLVEGVHFRLETTDLDDLGAKAVAVNLSDLAAMAVDPVALIVGLGLPRAFGADGRADAVSMAIEAAAAEYGVTVAGGDVTLAPVLTIAITALGRPFPGVTPVLRSGANEGDLLCVTGALGAAAAGLALLEHPALLPDLASRTQLIRAHRRPVPRLAEGRALAEAGATALMDVSDGLVLDAGRLARASGVRAVLDIEALPLAPGVPEVARALGLVPGLMAATGGEDYGLLAAIPPRCFADASTTTSLTAVGELMQGEPGVEVRDGTGAVVEVGADEGWQHDV